MTDFELYHLFIVNVTVDRFKSIATQVVVAYSEALSQDFSARLKNPTALYSRQWLS
jgi:hypothetical protein